MIEMPRRNQTLPDGLSLEKPANGLAALTLTESIESITRLIVGQWKNEDAFRPLAKHGIFPTRQALFFGPPGNGKTTACQWIAKQLDAPLYRLRCEQIINSYLGGTAKAMGDVMDFLEQQQEKCIVLLDEVESIFPSRGDVSGTCGREVSSAMTVFWQRLDRWTRPQIFILATNMADKLDPALLSRIELKLEFGPPTTEQCFNVVSYWAETLHEYGADVWGEYLREKLRVCLETESLCPFESFRELWHTIQKCVINHVTAGEKTTGSKTNGKTNGKTAGNPAGNLAGKGA